MSGNKRTAKTTVDFPPQESFDHQGRIGILGWSDIAQGGENIYHIRRYFENTRSKFDTKSIILEMQKKNSPVLKVYCGGVVARDICNQWETMDKGQNMFIRPDGTATSEAGYEYNVAHIIIQ